MSVDDVTDASAKSAIGNAIVTARKAAGMTQVALAKAVGGGQDKISRYEAGANLPPIDLVLRIDRACNQPLGYVLRLAGLVEDADDTASRLAVDPHLAPEARESLLVLYRHIATQTATDAAASVAKELAAGRRGRPRRQGPRRSA